MDRRIGCGLSLEEALKKAMEELEPEVINAFTIYTDKHTVVWAEMRDDGWRVYTQ